MKTNNLIVTNFRGIIDVLNSQYKRKGFIVIGLLMFNSIMELAGLGAILPIFTILLSENAIQTNAYLQTFYLFSGIGDEKYFILFLSSLIIGFILFKNLVSLLIMKYQAQYSFDVYRSTTQAMHRVYFKKDFNFFKSTNSTKIFHKIYTIPMQFSRNIILPTIMLVNEITILTCIVIGLILYKPAIIVLLGLIVMPTFYLFYTFTKKKIAAYAQEVNETIPILSKSIFESIFGYVDMKVTNTDKYFYNSYKKLQAKFSQIQVKSYVFQQAPTKVIESSMFLGLLLIIGYGVFYFDSRSDLVTFLAIFALAAYRIMPSINRMMIAIMSIKSFQYVFDILKVTRLDKGEIFVDPKGLKFEKSLRIENLCFKYPDQKEDSLKSINVEIAKGEVIGFIGKSGSGKTTLVNVLLQFLQQHHGNIRVDDLEIRSENLIDWRNLIGYVQQEVYLVDGSFAENIAFGYSNELIDFELVNQVIDRSSLREVVNGLSHGINTQIGERGVKLSGGQRQRIGIARALYSGAQILVFDEATSALDNSTEQEITDAINQLAGKNLTMIIIAHRYTTLKYCNRIIEMADGEIKVVTNYDALMKSLT